MDCMVSECKEKDVKHYYFGFAGDSPDGIFVVRDTGGLYRLWFCEEHIKPLDLEPIAEYKMGDPGPRSFHTQRRGKKSVEITQKFLRDNPEVFRYI